MSWTSLRPCSHILALFANPVSPVNITDGDPGFTSSHELHNVKCTFDFVDDSEMFILVSVEQLVREAIFCSGMALAEQNSLQHYGKKRKIIAYNDKWNQVQ